MTSISNAEMLDTVRRLRSYMTTLDNCHSVLTNLSRIDDPAIRTNMEELIPEVMEVSRKTSVALKNIESSRAYRDMLKTFNMKDESED